MSHLTQTCLSAGHGSATPTPLVPSRDLPSASESPPAATSRKTATKKAQSTAKKQHRKSGQTNLEQANLEMDISTPIFAAPAAMESAASQDMHAEVPGQHVQQHSLPSLQDYDTANAQTALEAAVPQSSSIHEQDVQQPEPASLAGRVGLSLEDPEMASSLSPALQQTSLWAFKPAGETVSALKTPAAAVADCGEDTSPPATTQVPDYAAAGVLPTTTSRRLVTMQPSPSAGQPRQQQQVVDNQFAQTSWPSQENSSNSAAESDDSSGEPLPASNAVQQLTAAMWSIFGQQPPGSDVSGDHAPSAAAQSEPALAATPSTAGGTKALQSDAPVSNAVTSAAGIICFKLLPVVCQKVSMVWRQVVQAMDTFVYEFMKPVFQPV